VAQPNALNLDAAENKTRLDSRARKSSTKRLVLERWSGNELTGSPTRKRTVGRKIGEDRTKPKTDEENPRPQNGSGEKKTRLQAGTVDQALGL
jgi:hypothetical protein